MAGLLPKLRELTGLPIVVNPNAGLPVERDGKTCYDVGPEEFASWMGEIARGGAWVVGGCCGTSPEHIRRTVAACAGLGCQPLPLPSRTVVTSGLHWVEIGKAPVIIGERINPTGKKKLNRPCEIGTFPIFSGKALPSKMLGPIYWMSMSDCRKLTSPP